MSDLIKTAIRLDSDDLNWFKREYQSVGYNRAIRVLMRRHRRAAESKKGKARNGIKLTDADLSGLGD